MSPKIRGVIVFLACLVIGFLITAAFCDYALRDVPRIEVYEAMYRDRLAVQYTFLGWLLTLVLASACGVFAGRGVNFQRRA